MIKRAMLFTMALHVHVFEVEQATPILSVLSRFYLNIFVQLVYKSFGSLGHFCFPCSFYVQITQSNHYRIVSKTIVHVKHLDFKRAFGDAPFARFDFLKISTKSKSCFKTAHGIITECKTISFA